TWSSPAAMTSRSQRRPGRRPRERHVQPAARVVRDGARRLPIARCGSSQSSFPEARFAAFGQAFVVDASIPIGMPARRPNAASIELGSIGERLVDPTLQVGGALEPSCDEFSLYPFCIIPG